MIDIKNMQYTMTHTYKCTTYAYVHIEEYQFILHIINKPNIYKYIHIIHIIWIQTIKCK